MKLLRGIGIVLLLISLVFVRVSSVRADDCQLQGDDFSINDRITKCLQAMDGIIQAEKPHLDALQKMEANIAAIQARIKIIEGNLIVESAQIIKEEKQMSELLELTYKRVGTLYRRTVTYNPLLPFLTSTNVGSVLRAFTYQEAVINDDKKSIAQTAVALQNLEDRKAKLEKERATLTALKADTDTRAASVRKLVASAEAYKSQLSGIIAQLSARQQQYLAQKLAGLGIPLFAISGGGCSSDLTNGKDPGFSGGFGFFTFGVPNRVGLNQYGAWGRAKAGKSYDEILRAYYNFDEYRDVDVTIKVNNGGNINQGSVVWSGSLDDYVKRVYEVPDSWTDNDSAALKAQAIAVRSYALAATNNGANSICSTQQCQVFKPEEKGGNWSAAVNATSRKVMVQGGTPIKAFFSSTHGGYVYNTGDLSGWSQTSYTKRAIDTTTGSVSSFSDLRSTAYDRDSPWFYCDWGGRSQYGGTAWLKPEEVADIVNVLLLAKQDGSSQAHLSQTDKPNPDGTDTWDAATVRSKLGSSAYGTISSISLSADFGTGRVTSVNVSGDGKSNSFDGNDFKTYFNLRAPASIQIVGPLYNVERK
jgi:SpoIID/LytB domain protein